MAEWLKNKNWRHQTKGKMQGIKLMKHYGYTLLLLNTSLFSTDESFTVKHGNM